MARLLPAATLTAVALWLATASGCGIDLTDSLNGRPCAEGQKCLDGYVCVDSKCVLAGSAGASGKGGTSGDASVLGAGGASTGGAAAGGSSSAGADAATASSGGRGGPDGGQDAAPGNDASDGAAGAGAGGAGAGGAGAGGVVGTGGTPAIGDVVCRNLSCTGGDACCLTNWSGFPNVPAPSEFACSSGTTSCVYALRCDGDHDCDSDEDCCGSPTSGRFVVSCQGSCGDPGDIRIECTAPEHCGGGAMCCGDWSNTSGRLVEVRCASSCSSPDIRFCRTTADCPSGQNCGESATLPGLRRCGQ